jgi:hypothetical protein
MIIDLLLNPPASPVSIELDLKSRQWRVVGGGNVFAQHGFALSGVLEPRADGSIWIFEQMSGRPKRNTLIILNAPTGDADTAHPDGRAVFKDTPRPYFRNVEVAWTLRGAGVRSFNHTLATFLGATGAGPGIRHWVDSTLKMRGFRAAGPNSVGIVAYPRTMLANMWKGRVPLLPESSQLLGHTAEIIRLDGRIVAVRGFEPTLTELCNSWGSTVAGRSSVSSYITTGDDALLTTRYAMTAEIEVPREVALRQFEHVRDLRTTSFRWTGEPEVAAALGRTGEMNCVQWAMQDAMRAAPEFGAELRLGTPVPSGQGNLMARMKEMQELERLGQYRGPVKVGSAPRSATAVKGIGTGLFVLNGAVTIAELRDARNSPDYQGELTGRAVGTFAGSILLPEVGIALCVAFGLVTGGVVLIPIAICLGIVGAEAGGALGGHLGGKLDYHAPVQESRVYGQSDVAPVTGPDRR